MAATNLTIDVIQLLFGLVYLAPSIVLEVSFKRKAIYQNNRL